MPFFFVESWPEVRDRFSGLREITVDAGREPSAVKLIPFLLDEPSAELIEEMTELGAERIVFSVHQERDHDKFLRAIEGLAAKFVH